MPTTARQLGAGGDPLHLVISLFRYYGIGKKHDVRRQIVAKAASYFQNLSTNLMRSSWLIYRRLIDFGLLAECGSPVSPSWQWNGDQVWILNDKRVIVSDQVLTDSDYEALLTIDEFTEVKAYSLPPSAGLPGGIGFLETMLSDRVRSVLKTSGIQSVWSSRNSAGYTLPSISDAFYRLSSPLEDASLLSIEFRDQKNERWIRGLPEGGYSCYAARMKRLQGPGFRYLLYLAETSEWIELQGPDWLEMFLWWKADTRWHVYQFSGRSYFPEVFFLKCPSIVRQSIVQRSMRWPNRIIKGNTAYYAAADMTTQQLRLLRQLYYPVLEVHYEH